MAKFYAIVGNHKARRIGENDSPFPGGADFIWTSVFEFNHNRNVTSNSPNSELLSYGKPYIFLNLTSAIKFFERMVDKHNTFNYIAIREMDPYTGLGDYVKRENRLEHCSCCKRKGELNDVWVHVRYN